MQIVRRIKICKRPRSEGINYSSSLFPMPAVVEVVLGCALKAEGLTRASTRPIYSIEPKA